MSAVLTVAGLLVVSAAPASATPTAVSVSGPWGVSVDSAADTAYVVSRSGNAVVPVSGAGVAGSSAAVGSFPLGAVFNPVNGYVYVANYSGGSVSVINPGNGSTVATVSTTGLGAVGAHPYWVDVDSSTGKVVVSFFSGGGTVGVIDTSYTLTALSLPAGQGTDSHVGVAVDSSNHVAYVSDSTAGLVDVVPLGGAAPSTVSVGGQPAGVAYDSGSGKVYVGFQAGTVVKAIDTGAGNAVSSIPTGSGPSSIAVAPGTHAVFATSTTDGTLTVIDGSSGAVTNTITPGGAGDYLTWAAVDSTHNRLYLNDFSANKVFVAAPADTEVTPTYSLSPSSSSVSAGSSVTYTATPSTGSQPVTFYDTSSGSTAISSCTNVPLSGGSASCTITYPSAGSYSVTAHAAEKTFLYSAAVSAAATVTVATSAPSAGPPSAPNPVTAAAGDTSATLSFTVPTTHGSPITGYEYSLDQGSTWTALSTTTDSADLVTATIGNLVNGTSYAVQVRARSALGPSPASTPATIIPVAGPSLTGGELARGRVGDRYAATVQATGGLTPYTFALASGSLPPGVALATDGTLSGIPTTAGTYRATVTLTDAASSAAEGELAITVDAATAATLPAINRSRLIAVPTHPDRYSGPLRLTKAWRASASGVDAYPVPALRHLDLVKGEAATLSGDGLFNFDSGKLTAQGRAQVRALGANLKAEARKVRCEGYTDYAGAHGHEMSLSRQRAQAVCAALHQQLAGLRFSSTGYGPEHPAVVGGTPRTRRENRRVVVLVLS